MAGVPGTYRQKSYTLHAGRIRLSKTIRLLRLYVYYKKEQEFLLEYERIRRTDPSYCMQFIQQFFDHDFNQPWFETLPETFKLQLLLDYFAFRLLLIENDRVLYQLLKKPFCL
ncbi:MAG: hypothetical protein R3C11_30020 [Planctomycetaceae bacterium]